MILVARTQTLDSNFASDGNWLSTSAPDTFLLDDGALVLTYREYEVDRLFVTNRQPGPGDADPPSVNGFHTHYVFTRSVGD